VQCCSAACIVNIGSKCIFGDSRYQALYKDEVVRRAQIFELNETPLHCSSMYVSTFRHVGACPTYCLLRILSACHRKTRRPAPQIFGQNPKISTYVPACVVSRLPSIQCLIGNSTTFCHSSTNFGPASNTTMRTSSIIQFCSFLSVLTHLLL
jgi:hypothetical protein